MNEVGLSDLVQTKAKLKSLLSVKHSVLFIFIYTDINS